MGKANTKINEIKLIISDFDGVFTDNKVLIDENGNELVCCDRSDGIGISKIREIGINVIILSSERNNIVRKRAKKLNIECYNGIANKYEFLTKLIKKKRLEFNELAYIGNDINDLECMKKVGLSIAVKDAAPEVIRIADIVLNKNGGNGSIRELCDMITAVYA